MWIANHIFIKKLLNWHHHQKKNSSGQVKREKKEVDVTHTSNADCQARTTKQTLSSAYHRKDYRNRLTMMMSVKWLLHSGTSFSGWTAFLGRIKQSANDCYQKETWLTSCYHRQLSIHLILIVFLSLRKKCCTRTQDQILKALCMYHVWNIKEILYVYR